MSKGKITDTFVKNIKPETVVEKTGKTWEEWGKILDNFDVRQNGSPAGSRYLREEYRLSMWWSNTIVSRYKQLNDL